jgi:alcohol dehydrogenase, propanol-preferring
MSRIPAMDYGLLWGERSICSFANLTRRDGEEFFIIAQRAGVRTHIQEFGLTDANSALNQLRIGKLRGAAVLTMNS